MRIKEISVKKLFGVFDHSISLNLEERITIIYGPNGYGKTIMLGMLDGFFNSRYVFWRTTPFEEFGIDFDDGGYLRIRPFKDDSEPGIPVIDVDYTEANGKLNHTSVLFSVVRGDTEQHHQIHNDPVVELERPKYIHGTSLEGTLRRTIKELLEMAKGAEGLGEKLEETPWLRNLKKSVSIHFAVKTV